MAKGFYHHIRQLWRKPKQGLGPLWRERLIKWRKTDAIVKVDKPLRLDRARSLGYKAKKGIYVARVRVKRGGRKRPRPTRKGRRTKRQTLRKVLKMNYKAVAERRAAQRFANWEVLNSYWVAQDGKFYWFEVILVNPIAPEIKKDKQLGWLASRKHRNRALRGLTSAGRKSRGLHKKGKGAEKVRPSKRAQSGERLYKKSRAK